MTTTVNEENIVILGNLDVANSGRLNTNNISGGVVSVPAAGLTTLFLDTNTNEISYINTSTTSVLPIYPRSFAFIGVANAVSFSNVETEITFTTTIASGGGDVSLSGGRLTLSSVGTYFVEVEMSYETSSGVRSTTRTRLSDDAGVGFLVSSEMYTYHRNTSSGVTTGPIHYYYEATSVPVSISVFGLVVDGPGTMQAVAEGCRISAKRIL